MLTFHLILFLSLGVLWGEVSGSVIRKYRFTNHGTEFPEKFKDVKVKTFNALTDKLLLNNAKIVESLPAAETSNQSQVLLHINRKDVTKRNTSIRTNNNANYSDKNKSLLQTLQANSNNINVRITDSGLNADLISNQTFPLIDERPFKKNISDYKTISGKVNNISNPWCSISINLLIGNSITIKKFLIQPSENHTQGKPLNFYNLSTLFADEIELSATNKRPHISKAIDVTNSSGNLSNGKDTLKHILSNLDENNHVLNVSPPLNTSLSGLSQSSITKISEKTTDAGASSLHKQNKSSVASFNLEPSHYDDVDPSGVEIGSPITFFPPENCSDTITTAFTNKCTVNDLYKLTESLTTSKAPYYDDVDPSGIEIGSPITFFPPENCNDTKGTTACLVPTHVK